MEHHLTDADLAAHLRRRVRFVLRSAAAYDQGDDEEAVRLASELRVLLHHRPPNSRSLLEQLELQSELLFYDNCLPLEKTYVVTGNGPFLHFFRGSEFEYVPRLDGVSGSPPRLVHFPTWWDQLVVRDQQGHSFTRGRLIRLVADKEGVHIDPVLEGDFAALSRGNSMGWTVTDGQTNRALEVGPERACVRHFAHEVIVTLALQVPEAFEEPSARDHYRLNAIAHTNGPDAVEIAGPRFSRRFMVFEIGGWSLRTAGSLGLTARLGRNDPCPCGSGRKWKSCHGRLV